MCRVERLLKVGMDDATDEITRLFDACAIIPPDAYNISRAKVMYETLESLRLATFDRVPVNTINFYMIYWRLKNHLKTMCTDLKDPMYAVYDYESIEAAQYFIDMTVDFCTAYEKKEPKLVLLKQAIYAHDAFASMLTIYN